MNDILIIEDEEITAKKVKEALELNDIKAEIAGDGAAGLKRIKNMI